MTFSSFFCPTTCSIIILVLVHLSFCQKINGPIFIIEPKGTIEYQNTKGAHIDCSAFGNPSPTILWYYKRTHGQDELKVVEDTSNGQVNVYGNGTLILHKFSEAQAPQHGGFQYICRASNVHGTIVSTAVDVRIVMTSTQRHHLAVQVYDVYVIAGNTALFKCNMPVFYSHQLVVKAWIREDNLVIKANTTLRNMKVTRSGNLHIMNVTNDMNLKLGFWCQVSDKITGQMTLSETSGRLRLRNADSVVGPRWQPPKISDAIDAIDIMAGGQFELACLAAGQPVPHYKWLCGPKQGQSLPKNECLKPGFETTLTTEISTPGTYTYLCVARNQYGMDTKKTTVVVRASLEAFIEPSYQKVDSGKLASLECKMKGYPVEDVSWKFNGQSLEFDSMVEKSESRILIKSTGRQHEGMYQCFVKNKWQAVQATAQLKLGDVAPSLLRTFKGKVMQPGPSISLKCQAIGRPTPRMRWYFNDRTIQKNSRYIIRNSDSANGTVTSTLVIKNMRNRDGGTYACQATNDIGSIRFQEKIAVYGLPHVHPIDDITVADGEDVVLNCFVSGYPVKTIEWFRGGRNGFLPRYAKDFGNGSLALQNVANGKDEGRYTCRADNGRGQSSQKSTRLNILVKPEISKYVAAPKLEIGASFSTICSVIKGDEPVKITWLKNNKSMELETGTDISTTKMYSVLQIRQVSEQDAGSYTCLAQNTAGQDTITVQLQIYTSPKWTKAPESKFVKTGQRMSIPCQARGFPTPRIEWFIVKGKRIVALVDDTRQTILKNGSLVFQKAVPSHSGKYSCIASNGIVPDLVGEITVDVGDPPKVSFLNTSSVQSINQTLTLVCRVLGIVSTEVSWTKNSKVLLNDSKSTMGTVQIDKGQSSRLIIKNLNFDDSGEYVCRASNKYGDASTKTDVNIFGAETDDMAEKKTTWHDRTKQVTLSFSIKKDENLKTTEKLLTTSEVTNLNIESENSNEDSSVKVEYPSNPRPEETRESSESVFGGAIDMGNILFIVPVVVIIILFIAVIVTLIVYLSARRRDNNAHQNNPGMTIDRRSTKGTLERGSHKMVRDKDYYYPSSESAYRDSRYGRLERPPALPPGMPPSNRSSAAYEIPDYYSGTARPYATLQLSSRRPSENANQQHNFVQAQSSL